MVNTTQRICSWDKISLFYNLESKSVKVTPVLTSGLSRKWFNFDTEKIEGDEIYKILCHRNSYFTLLFKNKVKSKAIAVTYNLGNIEQPETRIFDIYEIDRYPEQLIAYETDEQIILEFSELSKEYVRVLQLNGPRINIKGTDKVGSSV